MLCLIFDFVRVQPINHFVCAYKPPTHECLYSQTTEEVDIDLGDPEVEKAALKIQGAFKGLKARKSTSPNEADAAGKM